MKYFVLILILSFASCLSKVSSSLGEKENLRIEEASNSSDKRTTTTSRVLSPSTTTSTTTTSSSTSSSSSTSTSSTTSTTLEKTVTFNQFKRVITDHCIGCHRAGGQANTMEFDNIQGFIDAQYVIKGQWEGSPLLYRSKFYDDDPDSDQDKVDEARQDMPRSNNTYDEDDYKLLKQFILEL